MAMVIKIRAYHLEDKKMVSPEDISLYTFKYLQEAKHLKLMMFTGLLDKHGKEIYEGDIVEIIGALNAEVYWDFGSWQLRNQGRTGGLLFDIKEQVKVLGNIYENPKLLK